MAPRATRGSPEEPLVDVPGSGASGKGRAPPRRAMKTKLPPDDATLAIRDAIRAHVPDAIHELARLAREALSEQARVSAINALIDRGYGNLKVTTDGEDGAHGITVRFVAPAEKP